MAIFIVEKIVDGVMMVDLRGRITLGPETETVRTKLKELLSAGQHRIILNLGEVTYLDSVGLGTLIAGYTSARNAGGNLKLLHLPRGVQQLLQITRLSTVFEIYEDLGLRWHRLRTRRCKSVRDERRHIVGTCLSSFIPSFDKELACWYSARSLCER